MASGSDAPVKRPKGGIRWGSPRRPRVVGDTWTYELDDQGKAFLWQITFGDPVGRRHINLLNELTWDPTDKQRIPREGAWVMILRPPYVTSRARLKMGEIYYAKHLAQADQYGFLPHGRYQVQIETVRGGTIILEAYEYSRFTVPEVLNLWQKKEIVFHPTNIQLSRFNDIVHYARSRGIGLEDAMVMALGSIQENVGWFEPTPQMARLIKKVFPREVVQQIGMPPNFGDMEVKLVVNGAEVVPAQENIRKRVKK